MERPPRQPGLLGRPEGRIGVAAVLLLAINWPLWADFGWSTAGTAMFLFGAWLVAIAILFADAWLVRRAGSRTGP
jgi:hypothetical protein